MKNSKRIFSLAMAVLMLTICFVFAGCGGNSTSTTTSGNKSSSTTKTTSAVETTVPETTAVPTEAVPSDAIKAVIDIKDYGTITLALYPSAAPITVENFVSLAKNGFYDGLTLHRIMEGFMMQGGDPLGNGTGGSEKTIKGEFTQNGVNNPLTHSRGAISMARSNDPDSASSQFFIVHQDSTFLDGQYACFGYVTDGIEVVDKVCENAKPVDSNGTIMKSEQPVINSIKIVE